MEVHDLPRVNGRHRNRALAAERRRHAVELALTGFTYQQIADQLGYANRGTVHRIVKTALTDRQIETVDELGSWSWTDSTCSNRRSGKRPLQATTRPAASC